MARIKNKKTKKKKKEQKTTKTQKYSKMSFSVISQNFPFFGVGVQNFPFLTTWPKKRAPQNTIKNRGFSKLLFEETYASRNGHFWTKKTKSRNSSYHFFLPISSLSTTKTQKVAETPIFTANLKKIFSIFELKH